MIRSSKQLAYNFVFSGLVNILVQNVRWTRF